MRPGPKSNTAPLGIHKRGYNPAAVISVVVAGVIAIISVLVRLGLRSSKSGELATPPVKEFLPG